MDAPREPAVGRCRLDAAVEIPSHAPLLRAMRRIRPIDADQEASNQMGVMGELFLPFIAFLRERHQISAEMVHSQNQRSVFISADQKTAAFLP